MLDHARFVLGPEVAGFEGALAQYGGFDHAVGVSSGTDALLATFMALDLAPGDEVLLTPYTFISTATSVLRAGLRPVFVDLASGSWHPDYARFEAAWTPRTKAVLVVHLFGEPLEIDDLVALCHERGATLVEDCAQAIGGRFADGSHVGSKGSAGTLSFFPAKNLGAFGDGGAVLTSDEELARKVRAIRQHGCEVRYRHDRLGGNFRLDAMQAAMLGVLLPKLDGWVRSRTANAHFYAEHLAQAARHRDCGLKLPADHPGHVWNQYVIRLRDRDAVRKRLTQAGVGTAIYYPGALHQQPALAVANPPTHLPQAEQACSEALALPVYPGLSEAERAHVVAALLDALH
jgi:dTDP-4-amino-4,6-dideoxygalactose transaminase